MNTPESRWTEIATTPSLSEWPELLKRRYPFQINSELSQLRSSARTRLVDAAQQYVRRLSDIAAQAHVAIEAAEVLTGDSQTQPIIMTGHQPVMFHGGLTFKYDCTEQTAVNHTAIGIAVTIDTDEGDPGAFPYPQIDTAATKQSAKQLNLAEISFCESRGLYGSVPLLTADQLNARLQTVRTNLEQTAGPHALKDFEKIGREYCRLATAGVSAAEANLITRWSRGIGSRLLELPLSSICCFPEVLQLTASVLTETRTFVAAYNNSLQQFRKHHSLRNQVNPFPDLQTSDEGTELPFWVVDTDHQTRHRLFMHTVDRVLTLVANGKPIAPCPPGEAVDVLNRLALRNVQLIPRGALITAFLRLLFADLFVHGIGGGHYDAFTTTFIESWWEVAPPPFVVASASEYLFAARRSKIQNLQVLNQNLRDLRFNPQRHFGTGEFTESVEAELQTLHAQKESTVAQLKLAQTNGKSAREIGHQIQLVSNRIKEVVDNAFNQQLKALNELTPQTAEAVNCRTYPWFLFDNHR